MNGLAQKSVVAGRDKLIVERGRPRPHGVRNALDLKFLDAVAVSRFARIAGEGACAPSINRVVPVQIDFFTAIG